MIHQIIYRVYPVSVKKRRKHAKYQSIENLYDHIDELSPGKTTTTIKENKELAYLSKELATICTDCDLEFNLEEAVLGDLYNEDVYKWFKNLEFKSLISRFGSMEIDQSLEIEKNFSVIENLSEADLVFANIKPMDNQPIGLYMIIDNNELLGVSLCFSEKKIYLIKKVGMITEDYLTNQVEKLSKNKFSFSVIGLKNHLKNLKVSEDDLVFDPALLHIFLILD